MLIFLISLFPFRRRLLSFRPDDSELDEFHPKASRTLFVGNLPPPASAGPSGPTPASAQAAALAEQLRERFSPLVGGDILDVDVKLKSGHALVQFSDVSTVARAIRKLDGEPLSSASSSSSTGPGMRLAFARMVPSKCVWCQGLDRSGAGAASVDEGAMRAEFGRFGKIQDLILDSQTGTALVYFDQVRKIRVSRKGGLDCDIVRERRAHRRPVSGYEIFFSSWPPSFWKQGLYAMHAFRGLLCVL